MNFVECAKAETLAKDLPDLENLLSSIFTEGAGLQEHVEELTKRVGCGELSTEGGVSLLDVKYHSMLSYVIDLVMLLRMKLRGQATASCQPRHRLVENRTVLEKVYPLEHKIKYQIDKLLQQSTQSAAHDPLSLKPNIDELESKLNDSASETEDVEQSKKYVPPRIAASHYDFEDGSSDKKLQQARERALKKSSIIRDLAQETSDAPVELSEQSTGRKRVQRERQERTRYEESNMTRINLTKKQKNMERQLMRQSELNSITKFGDIGVLDGNFQQVKTSKRKTSGKYKAGKKWKRFKK